MRSSWWLPFYLDECVCKSRYSKKRLVLCYSSYINHNSHCHFCSKFQDRSPYTNLESRRSLLSSQSSKHFILLHACISPQNTLLTLLSKVCLETWHVEYACFSWHLSCHSRRKCIDRVRCIPIVAYVFDKTHLGSI